MKRIWVLFVTSFVLLGCGAEEVEKNYILTSNENGITIEDKIAVYADGDVVNKTIEEITYTFEDASLYTDEIKVLMDEYEQYKLCPGVVFTETSPTDCSKYINFEYSLEGNILKSKETIRYDEAIKNKDAITSQDLYSENTYYSVEKFAKELEQEGFIASK